MGDLFKVKAFRPWGDIQRLLYRFEASPNKSDKPPVSIVHHLPQNSRRTPVQIYNKKYCGNIWFSQFRDHTSICPLLLTIAIIPNSESVVDLLAWRAASSHDYFARPNGHKWPQMTKTEVNQVIVASQQHMHFIFTNLDDGEVQHGCTDQWSRLEQLKGAKNGVTYP